MAEHDWFAATFSRGPTGAALMDPDGHVLRWNPVFRDLLGETGEPLGRPLTDFLSGRDHRLEAARGESVQERRTVEVRGVALETAQRDRRHLVDAEFYPQTDAHGGVTGTLVVVQDRTRLRESSEESARLFYEAFLHSTNAMELTDRDGYLVDVNPAFERIYGYRKDEVIGHRPSLVASGRTDRATYGRMWRDLLDPGVGSWSGEVINRDREGAEHPVLLAINAVRDANGGITHFLGVAVDLTERRAWERAAMHSERMHSLGQLAAGVAHEINTPLASIMLIAESIRRRTDDRWTQERITSLLSQTESAARIVRGLLDFARRPESRLGAIDLGELATTAIEFLRGKQSADVEVVLEVPAEPLIVHGDREQLNQVVLNLLNNAYDSLENAGRVVVRVFAQRDWAHLQVSDTGSGIPPEVRPHVFEPFFTTKPEGKGTGLGLAICHGILQSHGGTIQFETEVGRGTTFDVRLPLADGAPPPPRDPSSPGSPERGIPDPTRTLSTGS